MASLTAEITSKTNEIYRSKRQINAKSKKLYFFLALCRICIYVMAQYAVQKVSSSRPTICVFPQITRFHVCIVCS